MDELSEIEDKHASSNLDQLRQKYLVARKRSLQNLERRESAAAHQMDHMEEQRNPQETALQEDAQLLESTRRNPLFQSSRLRRHKKQSIASSTSSLRSFDSKDSSLVAPKLRVFRSRSSPTKPLDGRYIVQELQKEENGGILRDLQKAEKQKRSTEQDKELMTTDTGSLFSFASDLSSTKGGKKGEYALNQSLSLTRARSIQGPVMGTFENVACEEDNVDDEALDTYTTYRVNQTYVNSVIRGISCSLPLYHQKVGGSNRLNHAWYVYP